MIGILTFPFRLVAAVLGGLRSLVGRRPGACLLAGAGVVAAFALVGLGLTFEGLPVTSIQLGFRGTDMISQYNPRTQRREVELNRLDEPQPEVEPSGEPSSKAYENVKVLGDVDSNEFLRLMAAYATWIAPTEGCAYCHSAVNMAEDTVYTKLVARRMTEMVRYINTNWGEHVGKTGVTCNTCHRGHGVPENKWFMGTAAGGIHGAAETDTGMDHPAASAGDSSLPGDAFTPFLLQAAQIRVQGTSALPTGNRQSIPQAEWTYSLMVHFADSLGVSCNFCHNTRAFSVWDQGTPNRVTAWHGIRMVRELNNQFMVPLTGTFPPGRLGPVGDVAKINCATCHQGAYKPFYGASELQSYPELKGPDARRQAAAQPADAPFVLGSDTRQTIMDQIASQSQATAAGQPVAEARP
ncbi:MAG: photosynthetic reaction center cytochrome PufC [Janthinobacterium lividum]